MNMKQWPSGELPREKLQRLGVGALSDAELLAILLRVGTQGTNALEQARGLIAHFGSLSQVFAAPATDLLAYKGMGQASYCQFAVVLEIGKRVLSQKQQGQVIKSKDDVLSLLAMCFCNEVVEVLWAIWLDSNNRVLGMEEVSRGSISHHVVYPRELVKRALAKQAAAVILAHNHPSGCMTVSKEDRESTATLQAALKLLDIVLLDHLVVVGQESVSVLYPQS